MEHPPKLPDGYCFPTPEEAASHYKELQRELPEGHLLFGIEVETVALSTGDDDVLFRHIENPQRFTVVHLTWIGKTEINAQHPTVPFDGTFEEFRLYVEWFWNCLREAVEKETKS